MQRYLRPRCATCRRVGHTVCPQVAAPVEQPRVQRCCSFCGIAGHYKPKCQKYKIFVDEIKPFETDEMLATMVESILKDMQNIFSRFVKSLFNPVHIFGATNDGFRAFVKVFINYFDAEARIRSQQPQEELQPQPQQQPQQQPHNSKIALELCVNTSNVKKECGICLSEDIPCSKIAKLGCGHEFCCDCTEKFINAKPCCALCRADVKKVSVASKTALNKFKKNKKFSV
jgi:hypothetical protein